MGLLCNFCLVDLGKVWKVLLVGVNNVNGFLFFFRVLEKLVELRYFISVERFSILVIFKRFMVVRGKKRYVRDMFFI